MSPDKSKIIDLTHLPVWVFIIFGAALGLMTIGLGHVIIYAVRLIYYIISGLF